jgi:hypothetical protein
MKTGYSDNRHSWRQRVYIGSGRPRYIHHNWTAWKQWGLEDMRWESVNSTGTALDLSGNSLGAGAGSVDGNCTRHFTFFFFVLAREGAKSHPARHDSTKRESSHPLSYEDVISDNYARQQPGYASIDFFR